MAADAAATPDANTGLSSDEAAERLRRDGPNELPRDDGNALLGIVRDVLKEPMFQLLLGAGAVYLVLGDLGEALLLLGFACASIVITILQETRTERALAALRDLSSPRALVIRDGRPQRIAGRDVVVGDIVLLHEGDRVPADIRLHAAQELHVDESLLTGESVPVSKATGPADTATTHPGGDDLPDVFSGTLIVRGSGAGSVRATGPRSELGRIGALLAQVDPTPTSLHRETRRMVRIMASSGLAVSALIALLYGLTRGSWLEGALAGIALAMSLLPEEFPLVLTVFLALGAWRIARHRVLTRRPAAIEALGAATVLCTDKTGTLTQNRMQVVALQTGDAQWNPAEFSEPAAQALLACARRASQTLPVDPMDRALDALQPLAPELTAVREYGITPALPAVTRVWAGADGAQQVAAKGAPEAIARLCDCDAAALARIRAEVDAMALRGLRVLAAADADWQGPLPDAATGFTLRWRGLIGFSDPLRPGVADAIKDCRNAGIRVVMITGDYPATARTIAAEAGIDATRALTGAELDQLDDAALRAAAAEVSVYARVVPAQKLRIVEALKANGEVVAMTGDGVNDAPALKAAHIGVAMGGRGTDVAREAAGLVLLDDDFAALVAAVRQGRRIYDNLRKAMSYIVAVHVPIAGLSLLPLLFGWPMIMTPVHIVFLELVIDPACSIVFEAERAEDALMRQPPRDPREPLFSRRMIAWALVQGTAVLALVTLLFHTALRGAAAVDDARALAFVALVSTNFGLIFLNRSFSDSVITALRRPNSALWWMLALTIAVLGLVLVVPPVRTLFRFGILHGDDLAIALLAGLGLLVVLEWIKHGLHALWPKQRTSP